MKQTANVVSYLVSRALLDCVLSEESCVYRYQYDDQIELIAVWPADDESEIDGQVSVTQFSVDETEGSAELEISVYLTGITRQEILSAWLGVDRGPRVDAEECKESKVWKACSSAGSGGKAAGRDCFSRIFPIACLPVLTSSQ